MSRPAFVFALLSGACSSEYGADVNSASASSTPSCPNDHGVTDGDSNWCDPVRPSLPLPNPYVLPAAALPGLVTPFWSEIFLEQSPMYSLVICIDSKGLVVHGNLIDTKSAGLEWRRVENRGHIEIPGRIRLNLVAYRASGAAKIAERPWAHVRANVAGSTAGVRLAQYHDTRLRDVLATFRVPGSSPPETRRAPRGYSVMVGNSFTDGWLAPTDEAVFIVRPQERVDFDVSTSIDGKPVSEGKRMIDDDAFALSFSVGGDRP